MQTYCVSCKRNTENKNAKVIKTKNGRLQMKSNCSVCGKRKSQFVSNQKASGLLSSLVLELLYQKYLSILNIIF